MRKTNAKAVRSFFINGSLISELSETAIGLSFLARQAYFQRNYKSLKELSERLIAIPGTTAEIGQYFKALSLSQNGKGDEHLAASIYNQLTESRLPALQASALFALGWKELLNAKHDEARRYFIESGKAALSGNFCAPLAYVNSRNGLSALLAQNGAVRESVALLQDNNYLIEKIGVHFPAVIGMHHNNLAYGYYELGQSQASYYYSEKLISNPALLNYPEWQDTIAEIHARPARSTSFTRAASTCEGREPQWNLRFFPAPKIQAQIYLDYYGKPRKIFQKFLEKNKESEFFGGAFWLALEALLADHETQIRLLGYSSINNQMELRFYRFLNRNRINELFELIDDADLYLQEVTEIPETESSAGKIMSWLMPMLEQNSK